MGLLLLTACGSVTKVETKVVKVPTDSVVCEVIEKPLTKHMKTIVKNGEKILGAGGDDVIVSGSELSDTFDGACSK